MNNKCPRHGTTMTKYEGKYLCDVCEALKGHEFLIKDKVESRRDFETKVKISLINEN